MCGLQVIGQTFNWAAKVAIGRGTDGEPTGRVGMSVDVAPGELAVGDASHGASNINEASRLMTLLYRRPARGAGWQRLGHRSAATRAPKHSLIPPPLLAHLQCRQDSSDWPRPNHKPVRFLQQRAAACRLWRLAMHLCWRGVTQYRR